MISFEVECHTKPGQMVHVVGSGPLGAWDVAKSLVLRPAQYPVWSGRVSGVPSEGLEFKYVLADETPRILAWEHAGHNRRAANPSALGAEAVVLHHVFGDATRTSVEVVKSGGVSSTVSTDDEQDGRSSLCASDIGSTGGVAAERVLQAVQVEPSIRFGRFHHELGAFEEKYALDENRVLGLGMSGGVCLAINRVSGDEVAVKSLPTDNLDSAQRERIMAEVQHQLLMDHPSICRLLEVYEEPGCLRLVLDRMKGSDLFDHLARRGRYTERDAANYVRQMAAAVAYCHRNGVCHRDLKPENFCFESHAEDARLKMIDFGLSSIYEDMPLTQACGTIYYVAPEVLKQRYCKKCDMWSLGVLAYVLLDGHAPFSGRDDRDTVRAILSGKYSFPPSRWSNISKEAKDFIASLLRVDVSARLDAEGALAHPWLAEATSRVEAEELLRPLCPGVLRSMRNFSKSNALKRAVVRAIAPVATWERVAGWTEHFEALDTDGVGKVAMKDLARHLVSQGAVCAAEANDITSALAEAEDGREVVSFTAFLAACLAAHVQLDGRQLQSLFDRLDSGRSGRVSVEDVCSALGDVVDVAQVRAEFGSRGLTYNDFRWLMTMPGHRLSSAALRHLLSTHVSVEAGWKVSARRAKAKMAELGEAEEAARRENLAWRVMYKRAQAPQGEGAAEACLPFAPPPRPPQAVLSLESLVLARGIATREGLSSLSRQEVRAMVVDRLADGGDGGERKDLEGLRDEALAELLCRQQFGGGRSSRPGSTASTGTPPPSPIVPPRTPTVTLIKLAGSVQERWLCASAAAKDGDVEAARQENVMWRRMHLEQKRRV